MPPERAVLTRIMTTTAVYTVVGFIGPIVALILTPLYTRALGIAGYGTTDLLQTLAHVAYTMAMLGMPTVLASMYRPHDQPTNAASTVASAMLVVAGWALGVALLLILAAPWLAQVTHRADTVQLMYIQMIAMPFGVIHGTLLAVLRLREAVRLTAMVTLIGVVVTALTRIVLVLWWSWGVAGMVIAAALTHVLNAVVLLIWTRQWWWGRVNREVMRTLWWRGLPLMPSSVAMWMLLYQDRWLLAGRIDATAQGQYALAATLVTLLALVIDPFKNAWQPIALAQPATSTLIPTTLRVYVAVAGGIALGTGVWAPELLWVLGGSDANRAAPLVWPLLLVPLCSGAVAIVGLIPTARGQTTVLAGSTLVAAVLNTLLNLVLIPRYAAMGAGIATGVAALIMPITLWWQSQRLLPHPYAYRRMLGYVVLMVCGALLAASYTTVVPRLLICVGYLLVVLAMERTALLQMRYRPDVQ